MLASLDSDGRDCIGRNLERWAYLRHTLLIRLERILVDLPVFWVLKPVVEEGARALLGVRPEDLGAVT